MTEDKMVGWHHQLNGQEVEQAQGDGEEQGSLLCCSPQGCNESDMTERLKNTLILWIYQTLSIHLLRDMWVIPTFWLL